MFKNPFSKKKEPHGLQIFNKYDGQSVDQMIELEGKYRLDTLVTGVCDALREVECAQARPLIEAENTVLCAHTCECSVNGDGFAGFFSAHAKMAPIVAHSFNAIGCPKVAEIARRGIDVLDVDFLDAEAIEEETFNDDKEDLLQKLDEEFYKYPDGPIDAKIWSYIVKHRDSIKIGG